MAENTTTIIRRDIQAFKAVVDANVSVTDAIVNSLWRWFGDVEIPVPLPVMPLSDEERIQITKDILGEMDESFARLEKIESHGAKSDDLRRHEDGQQVDRLWRELAGVYAELVNEEVPSLPEEIKQQIQERIVSDLSEQFGVSEDEVLQQIRTDSSLRMRLRMAGISPDQIHGI